MPAGRCRGALHTAVAPGRAGLPGPYQLSRQRPLCGHRWASHAHSASAGLGGHSRPVSAHRALSMAARLPCPRHQDALLAGGVLRRCSGEIPISEESTLVEQFLPAPCAFNTHRLPIYTFAYPKAVLTRSQRLLQSIPCACAIQHRPANLSRGPNLQNACDVVLQRCCADTACTQGI